MLCLSTVNLSLRRLQPLPIPSPEFGVAFGLLLHVRADVVKARLARQAQEFARNVAIFLIEFCQEFGIMRDLGLGRPDLVTAFEQLREVCRVTN